MFIMLLFLSVIFLCVSSETLYRRLCTVQKAILGREQDEYGTWYIVKGQRAFYEYVQKLSLSR